jgi:hypothetical protein
MRASALLGALVALVPWNYASALILSPFYHLDTAKLVDRIQAIHNGSVLSENSSWAASVAVFDVEVRPLGGGGVPIATPLTLARAAFASPREPISIEASHFTREAMLNGWEGNTILEDVSEKLVLFNSVPSILAFNAHRNNDDVKDSFRRYTSREEALKQLKEKIRSTLSLIDAAEEVVALSAEGNFIDQQSFSATLGGANSSLLIIAEPKTITDYIGGANDGHPSHDEEAALAFAEELVSMAHEHGVSRIALLYHEAPTADGDRDRAKIAVVTVKSNDNNSQQGRRPEKRHSIAPVAAECLSALVLKLAGHHAYLNENENHKTNPCKSAVDNVLNALQHPHLYGFSELRPGGEAVVAPPSRPANKQPIDLDSAMRAFVERKENNDSDTKGKKSFREELLQPLQPYHTLLLDIATGLSFGGLEAFPIERIDALRKDDGLDTEGEASTAISQQMARWLHWRSGDNAFFTPQTQTVKEKFIAGMRARKAAEAKAKAEAAAAAEATANKEENASDKEIEKVQAMSEKEVKEMMKVEGFTAEP